MRISDWSSDVCSSDLRRERIAAQTGSHFLARCNMPAFASLMAKNRFPPFLRDATFSFRIAHGEKPVPTFSRDATFSFRIAHAENPVPTFSRDALEHPHARSGSVETLHKFPRGRPRSTGHTAQDVH